MNTASRFFAVVFVSIFFIALFVLLIGLSKNEKEDLKQLITYMKRK
jgi:hypothetical protein